MLRKYSSTVFYQLLASGEDILILNVLLVTRKKISYVGEISQIFKTSIGTPVVGLCKTFQTVIQYMLKRLVKLIFLGTLWMNI